MHETLNIALRFTQKAIDKMKRYKLISIDIKGKYIEQFLEDAVYDFYLQNATKDGDTNTKVRLLMCSNKTNKMNQEFIETHSNRVIALEIVNMKEEYCLVTGIELLPKKVGANSNRSIFCKTMFSERSTLCSGAISSKLMMKVRELPNAQQIYTKGTKIIRDWDSYLEIIEENAKNSQVELCYEGFSQGKELTCCTFNFNRFTNEEIRKLGKINNERVILFYEKVDQEFNKEFDDSDYRRYSRNTTIEEYIGTVDKVILKKNAIRVYLEPEYQELAIRGELNFPKIGNLRISKMGDLAQARNLRKGLFQLKNGNACNKNLDIILFDPKELNEYIDTNITLNQNELLLKTLNENQRLAVEGVLSAKDLFLIQGPPGTGKTTVIAEICYQNAIRGKKTLISSQTNLAVDNALSRLVHNPKIRILRKGNLSSVQEEGEKYTENRVVDTWLTKTGEACLKEYEEKKLLLDELEKLQIGAAAIEELCSRSSQLEDLLEDNRQCIIKQSKVLDEMRSQDEKIQEALLLLEYEIWGEKEGIDLVRQSEHIFYYLKEIAVRLNVTQGINNISELSSKLKGQFKEVSKQLKIEISNYIQYYDELVKNEIKAEYISGIQRLVRHNKLRALMEPSQEEHLLSIQEELFKEWATLRQYLEKSYAVTNLIEEQKALSICLNKNLDFLDGLIREYGIKDIMIVGINIPKVLEEKVMEEIEVQVSRLYNFKPNKLIFKIGLKRKWGVEVAHQLKKIESLLKLVENKIESLGKENNELQKRITEHCNLFLEELSQVQTQYTRIIVNNTSQIQEQKRKIKAIQPVYQACYKNVAQEIATRTIQGKKILEPLEQKSNEIIKEDTEIKVKIDTHNALFNRIFNTNIRLEDIRSDADIKAYYLSMIESKKGQVQSCLEIMDEWITRIRAKKYGDRDELQELYINTANVIGITCVQSGNRNFTEKYPNFDVVIVDEVSKATPPELVLPLLKGKKMVLVGDHKQLPPMIGNETFKELKNKMSNNKMTNNKMEDTETLEDDDLEYMKVSLFEELYRNIDEKNKVMLDIQYRMHSSIMNTINQFYIDEDTEGLKCGIKNEEVERNHELKTSYFNEKNNLLWIDIPLHTKYAEAKNERESAYNEKEVEVIEKILCDIDKSCEELGQKKEVAVITFYSAQAKLLQKALLVPNKFKQIILRIGTVDRFQGMEREIVIVSFVRNNNCGDIGFAEDPKRINVALSRAQKLLVIVGCSELFCEKNKHRIAKRNYRNILKIVNSYDGIRDIRQIFD